MIQITATMRILVAIEPVDLRKGIDGLAQFCREKLAADPFSGCLFIFRSRRGTTIKALALMAKATGWPKSDFPGAASNGGRRRVDPPSRWRLTRRSY
jgi:hypothetical protein